MIYNVSVGTLNATIRMTMSFVETFQHSFCACDSALPVAHWMKHVVLDQAC